MHRSLPRSHFNKKVNDFKRKMNVILKRLKRKSTECVLPY